MLDIDTLFAKEREASAPTLHTDGKQPETLTAEGNKAIHEGCNSHEFGLSGLNTQAPNWEQMRPRKSLQHNRLGQLGSPGSVGSLVLQGGDTETGSRAPGGGAGRNKFALHPSAVILLLAYCNATDIDPKEQADHLIELGHLPPSEQVRLWQTFCIDSGMQPWRLLTIPASLEGHDCSRCAHLLTRQYAGEGGRRQYHWACGNGYLILETGRGSERIWIAPPECTDWERWYPTDRR